MPHPSINGEKGASSDGERPFPDLLPAPLGSLAVPYRAQWGVLVLLWLLWKRTGLAFFNRWLLRLSWILPWRLYLAYRNHGPIPGLHTILSFEDYLTFQTVLVVRDAEILAARYIPYLALAIAVLTILPRLARGIKEFVDARSRQEATPAGRLTE